MGAEFNHDQANYIAWPSGRDPQSNIAAQGMADHY
jgi:hypothetical protein